MVSTAIYKNESLTQRLEESEEELAALRLQLVTIRDLYEKERSQNNTHRQKMQQLQNALSELEKQPRLDGRVEELQQHNKQLERVIQFLRERSEEAQLEVKQLREEFQASQQQVITLEKDKEELKQRLVQEEQLRQEHIQTLDSLQGEVVNLRQMQHQLEGSLSAAKEVNEEKEQALRMAQQHLGKKMKEVASLTDKNEEAHNNLVILQRDLADLQTRLAVTQQNIELQTQREKYLQDQLKNGSQNLELQVKKWEEKYFHIHEKWQETELRNRAFKALEERHHQAQALLANLAAVIAAPVLPSLGKEPVPHPVEEQRVSPAYPLTHPKEEKPTFFENQPHVIRYKQTLFD